MGNLLQNENTPIIITDIHEYLGVICAHMINFRRPGHNFCYTLLTLNTTQRLLKLL